MRTLLHPAASEPALRDTALLVARVAIGFVLVVHGWQKLTEYTIGGTTAAFGDMGVPVPAAAAIFVTAVEILGGALLILGLLTPIAAALNIVSLLGAFAIVHAQNGVFVEDGGFELVLALIAGLVVFVVMGAGRFGVDHLLTRRARAS